MKLYSDQELAKILDRKIFHLIGDCADELGVECYVVGGYVRDIFLERPSKDIDVVVVGSGIGVAELMKKKLGKKAHLSVFKNFGTAQVKVRAPLQLPPEGGVSGEINRYQTADVISYGLLKERAKEHRNNPTNAEKILWQMLRGNLFGEKFRRQHIIGNYIVDFVCLEKKLVIEVDGEYHLTQEQKEYDQLRTEDLKKMGFEELRFTNDQVMMSLDDVIQKIQFELNSSPSGGGWEGALEVEFVGARRESYSHDSRKPIVEDGTLEDDQNRRDFTINALAICLNKGRFGELVDPFDGLYDLEDGIVRTPLDPDITFSDDPLRMMRCVRFATQLGFFIEDATFEALSRNADRLKIISGERIQDELNKIIMSPHPSTGFDYLYRSGLLQIILPELTALDNVQTVASRSHKNNYYHTLEVLENVVKASPVGGRLEGALWLRWAALLHDIGKMKTRRWEPGTGWTFYNHNYVGAKMVPLIFRRLKLPMDAKMKYVQKLVDLHMRPIAIAEEQVTDSAVRRLLNDAGDDIDDLMLLCEADITSKNSQRKQRFLQNFQTVREKLADLKERDYKRLLQPVIDGNEIMEMFHLKPSREVGELKQTLKDAVLDNRVPNEREPLLQLLMEKAREMGLITE